ncbi:hypothetical protein PVA17_19210 [Lysinibacillus sp. CNPSo 3705]|uniref:hypothetical protein n=1 Tax=Lysinibacillus sp. CNPSo 3705 TaxID=3028148 RepID=UPI002363C975|nr:hypothetical protein [Lysinibacillus sp. CNPSo 3705]MDD1504871.1 hypothetical protein [Lysinibacillus sp. CNPSo 3705]
MKKIFTAFLDFIISLKVSLFVLGLFVILGTIEGVLEEYLDKRNNEAGDGENQSENQKISFWTKRRVLIFNYKLWRVLIILIILSVSFLSLIKVIIDIISGGLDSIDWRYVVLIPAFKIYKTFTKGMRRRSKRHD